MHLSVIYLVPLFLCWGSFINVLGYRLIYQQDFLWSRSRCPKCSTQLAWYDLIPILSWITLGARCRTCKEPISVLYPFIELLTAVSLTMLYVYVPHYYFFSYFIFFSALLVTIRSDLETMLISRYATLFLVPVGILLSLLNMLPITSTESIIGSIFGYGVLYGIARLFYTITKKNGLGQGDIDLLAFIGSFTGIIGCWATILVGSIVGSLFGIIYTLIAKPTGQVKLPFGPFLALGAISYVFMQEWFAKMLLGL